MIKISFGVHIQELSGKRLLVRKYTKVSYARAFDPTTLKWTNYLSSQHQILNDETMDAYELGWRTRPSDKLLIELSLYHYSTKNAIFSGPPKYEHVDVKTNGGELTFDYAPPIILGIYKGAIPIHAVKKKG